MVYKDMYRVTMACWDFPGDKPYADTLSGVELSLFESKEDAHTAIDNAVEAELEQLNDDHEKVDIYDSDGTKVGSDYPFRADDTTDDYDHIIRFWDGDDYRNVTGYDANKLEIYFENEDDAKKGINNFEHIKYRSFYVYTNKQHTFYNAELFDTCLFQEGTLEDILMAIDDFVLAFTTCRNRVCTRG